MRESDDGEFSLAEFARDLGSEQELAVVWRRVVAASVNKIVGAEHAGVTQISDRSASTPVCTDELVHAVDRHQYASGEGPCLSAAIHHEPMVRVADLRTDQRWPRFSAAVAGLPVRSILSFRLYTREDSFGALNLYSCHTDAFTDESVQTGTLLAAHAAAVAAHAVQSANLRVALVSRDVIGQAKGILMERHKLTGNEAFDLLITASQHTHRKLHEIATYLAETGELPTA